MMTATTFRLVSLIPVLALTLLTTLTACANLNQRSETSTAQVHTIRLNYSNAHLVVQPNGMLLVDAGLIEDVERLDEEIRSLGFDPSEISAVILTHGHPDHAGGAKWFQDRYGTPLIGGAGDEEMLEAGESLEVLCPTNGIAKRRLEDDTAARYDATSLDHSIDSETAISDLIAGLSGRLVPMPGHTPGSIVLIDGDAAYVGDLFRGSLVGRSPRVHFYMCDLDDNQADLKTLGALDDGAIQTFFVGHFGPIVRARFDRFAAD